MAKRKNIQSIISILTSIVVIIPIIFQLAVTVKAEEADKYPYNIFGRNGIEINAGNLCINGDVHTNKEAVITAQGKNINGRITTGNDIEKRVKHVYADTKIHEQYFTENCELYEDGYVKSEMNIHINNPVFSYRNIELDGNVALNSNIGTLMDINVTGEVKNANTAVVYSKYGNITINNDSTANINGLIYAPLGTLTINSPNVSINGVIIADKVIINGNSINLNGNDNIAGFIGTKSEVYDFSDLIYLPEEWLGDTDKDELFDIYEKVIDTDPLNPDTDGDKLPDGYEVLTLNTDPLEVDTDGNGISDADEDFDNDNLNNLGEYTNKTEPYNPDTDEDGLLDGDEIKKYKTDPLNPDTDNDGLLDGEEGYDGTIYKKYGVYFDPLNPDTNGNGILDGDEVFGQSKKQEVSTHDEVITEVKVDMSTNGSLERNLTIESMYGIDSMSSEVYAMIGEPFNFETPTKFDKATITFKVDKSKLGDTKFDNLLILWYDEENQTFKEMETVHNEAASTVSTTTTHFSQYMIVDSEKWFDNWEKSFVELRKMWSGNTSYYKALNTILVVDCSWVMSGIDPISYSIEVGYNGVTEDNISSIRASINSGSNVEYYMKKYGRRKCSRASICENIINNMGGGDRAALIMYADGVYSNTGLTGSYYSLISAVQNVNDNGGSLYLNNAVETALSYVTNDAENMYRIVVITHGNVSWGYDLSSYDYTNVSLNVVNLGGGSVGSYLESIVHSTGGEVYYGYPSSSLTGASGGSVTIPPQFIGEDSDGDGIPDMVELYGLKPNGQPINSNPYSKHSDGDGLEDNEELHFSREKMTYELDKSQYDGSVFVWSDPCLDDSDGDGLDDLLDNNPIDSTVHEFIIYETAKTDEYLKSCTGNDEGPDDLCYSNMTKEDLRNMPLINWSDFLLSEKNHIMNWKLLAWTFSSGDMVDIAQDMINYFLSGNGGTYSNDILTKEARRHSDSNRYINETTNIINDWIKNNNGDIKDLAYDIENRDNTIMVKNMKDCVDPPTYDDIWGGLGICVDGTYGNQIDITSYKFDGVNYEYTVKYTIYDIFGLDNDDISHPDRLMQFGLIQGFRSWYILQHWDACNFKYKPYITYIEFEETIKGSIK